LKGARKKARIEWPGLFIALIFPNSNDPYLILRLSRSTLTLALEALLGVAALLGISSLDQLEQAVRYVERGPLSEESAERIRAIWSRPE